MSAIVPSGVHHVAIKTTDPERLARFYREVLGLPEVRRQDLPDGSGVRSVWLACGDALLMLERAGRAGPSPAPFADDPPGLHLLALRIEEADRDHFRALLAQAGHPPVHETESTIYVLDPDGNRVGLSCYDSGRAPDSAPPARSAS